MDTVVDEIREGLRQLMTDSNAADVAMLLRVLDRPLVVVEGVDDAALLAGALEAAADIAEANGHRPGMMLNEDKIQTVRRYVAHLRHAASPKVVA